MGGAKRITRAILVLVALGAAGLAGCGFFKSEKGQVEDAVREGIKEKTGKTVDSLDVQAQGGGQYKGTATVAGEPWDVTATVSGRDIRWQAQERLTPEKVKKTSADVIREKTGSDPQNLVLTEQPDGQYRGTATIGGVRHDVIARTEGGSVVCEWVPSKR